MARRARHLDPEPWRWPRPRVLIESSKEEQSLAWAARLRGAGYSVAVCSGPDESAGTPERCPLAGPYECPLVAGADVVVSSLGLGRPEGRTVVEALRRRAPETPLVVTATSDEAERYSELVRGCTLVVPASENQVVGAVRALTSTLTCAAF
jgi:DNA-binding response OmpR family regulator